MKVLPLERHTYFIINVIHNTYPHTVFIFTHDYSRFLLISPSPYFHKQIKHSPLTYKAQNRMYKRCSQLTLQHILSPWMEGIIFTKDAANPVISQRYMRQCSNSSMCLLWSQRGSCFTLDQRQFLLSKHIHKNRPDNA